MNYNRSETVRARQNRDQSSHGFESSSSSSAYTAHPKKSSTATKDVGEVTESLRLIDDLKFFLATAPANWQENQVIRRYYLNPDEGFVSCVYWNNLYFVTGTDIVRCMVYKFQHFGREIIDRKKFEEGVFSDLRNLKCGTDAVLELPKSDFLEFLFKNSCLRTQKKQKVFFWFNVPHDKLMAEALERDLKKERMNMSPTTIAKHEPALSFNFAEGSSNIHTQLADHLEKQIQLYLPALAATSKPQYQENGPSSYLPFSASSASDYAIQTELLVKTSPEHSIPTKGPAPILEYGAPIVPLLETIATSRDGKYDFLSHPTPTHNQADPAFEDDFPLDYFHFADVNANEYLNLDPNLQQGVYANIADDNLGEMIDPRAFSRLSRPRSAVTPFQHRFGDEPNQDMTNQVFYNDEYLIEQTLPLRISLAGIPSSAHGLRSARYGPTNMITDEFFQGALHHTPISSTVQSAFFKNDPFGFHHGVGPGAPHPIYSGRDTPGQFHTNMPLLQSNGVLFEPDSWVNVPATQQLAAAEDGSRPDRSHQGRATNKITEQYPAGYVSVHAVQHPPAKEDQQTTAPIQPLPCGERLSLRRGLAAPQLSRGVHKPQGKTRKSRLA